MREYAIGQLLINDILPDDMRDYNRVWSKGTVGKVLTELAKKHPDQYKEVSHRLLKLGAEAAYLTNGDSFTLADMGPTKISKEMQKQLNNEVQNILARARREGIKSNDPKVTKAIIDACLRWSKKSDEGTAEESDFDTNALFRQAQNTGVGAQKPGTYKSIRTGDVLYVDQNNKPVPIPVTHSYAQGLRPSEYFAGAFGTRKGIVDLQKATQDAGYLSKQLVQIAHRLVVDSNDSTDPIDPDNPIGYPSTVDDPDNEGALLSMPVGGYKRNTILTPKILSDLKQKGIKNILVRSVIAGGPANGGIYAYDAGVRETGSLPTIGDFVGIKSVQAISEPITQSAISCLHPNTKVRMGDGTVKAIKDIKVGDTVLGADKQGYTAPVKVVNVFNNGVQPVYITVYRKSVKTNSVIAIAATKEHKALQITRKSNCKGEKYNNIIRELPIGEPGRHVSAVLARGPKEKREGKHENGALLLGLLLGDGCYTESVNRPCFSCADPSLIEELDEYMKSVDCRFAFHKGSQCYYRVSGLNNDGSGDNTRNPAKQLLLKYNMFGKYSFEKEIPEDVKDWDSDSVSALLSGLIITDGSIYKSNQAKHYHMSYTSTSYKLVKQVKDLLYLHCGASCAKIHINKSSRKRYLYSIVYSKPAELLRMLNFIKLYGVKEPLRKTAIEECKALLTIQDYYACKRIKQVFYGNVETLDIEVNNEDHLFVLANGMVVSNSKHSGGVAGAESGKAISGFKYINQLIQVPKHFPGGATHSTVDGKVERIRPAAQGGYYITVAGVDHYVRTDKGDDTPILVKVGDSVEAGDVMSDGIPNPATIVKYKGLGEGRRYFVNMFRDALDRAGSSVNRRNIEVLSRGLLSYVKLNDEIGDYSPDDILPYTMVAADYKPRDGYICREPKACKNMYLEKPVLHYTIGTRVTPSVIKELDDYNIKNITCHKDPPPFEPEMVRGMAHAATDPDWGTKMLGSYNKESLLESTRLGAISNTQGTSYVPALAFGDTSFGNSGALNQKQSSLSILNTVARAYGIK